MNGPSTSEARALDGDDEPRRGARATSGRPKGGTAERILAAAKDIIAREGLDAFRLGEVAASLGISTPAIYAHFPRGRTGLLDAITVEGVRGLEGLFPRSGREPLDELFSGVAGLVRFHAQHRAFMRIMFLDFAAPEGHPSVLRAVGPPGPEAKTGFRMMFQRIDEIVEACAHDGVARRVSSRVLLNVMIGATTLNLTFPPDPGAPWDVTAATVDGIVRDLVRRYLDISADAAAEASTHTGDMP